MEGDKLCFKISVTSKSERAVHRTKWSKALMEESEKAKYHFRLSKPARFGTGETMTVCIFDNYRVWGIDNLIDIDKTVQSLKEAEVLLDAVR